MLVLGSRMLVLWSRRSHCRHASVRTVGLRHVRAKISQARLSVPIDEAASAEYSGCRIVCGLSSGRIEPCQPREGSAFCHAWSYLVQCHILSTHDLINHHHERRCLCLNKSKACVAIPTASHKRWPRTPHCHLAKLQRSSIILTTFQSARDMFLLQEGQQPRKSSSAHCNVESSLHHLASCSCVSSTTA
jgi:hypothetical protein